MLYYTVPLCFLIAIIFFLRLRYLKKRDAKTVMQLIGLLLGVVFVITQFIIGPLRDDYGVDYLLMFLLTLTVLPRGILTGLLMGYITSSIWQGPLFVRLVCLVSVGVALFTILGGFLYWPHATTTSVMMGGLMGLLLAILQELLRVSTTTEDKLKAEELPLW